ncbi:hypothetical protein [Litchfieldia salsa]|uniref:YhfM-like domain-containing protein n=1 Tax=Litchfieldia salsa TaxID=930152 RepID=A0A1H0X2A2_9BACI|nr:hypothetical protein [Litchfieldia salsa]SDP96596.1 hypothetical protein SAMN05216565_12211 [Litchfieldia salsa]
MRKWYLLIFLVFFIITGCSSLDVNHVERIDLTYWENHSGVKPEDEFIDNENTLKMFVETVNNAKELDGQIIKTEPLLSFTLGLKDDKYKHYHFWINEHGEGYIQRLLPDKNGTFKIDEKSVVKLQNFFKGKEDVNLLSNKIEFENNN